MIELDDLTKRFGEHTAVDRVSFTVGKGEVLGFLGPNGAGKSTTMRMITGFLTPSSGSARVGGIDVVRDPVGVKRQLGYLPEGAPAYPDMTAGGFLKFIASVRGFSGGEAVQRIGLAAEKANITEVMLQPIGTLSKGFKRRVGLAQALLHDPEILIMDEPTDGLDPNQKHEVRRLIAEMSGEKAIIISTHILEEVEAICSRAIVIARGRVVADETPAELEARSRRHNGVRVRLSGDVEAAEKLLGAVDEIDRVTRQGDALFCFAKAGQPIAARIADLLRDNQIAVQELEVERGRLDDVFRDITMNNAGDDGPKDDESGEVTHV